VLTRNNAKPEGNRKTPEPGNGPPPAVLALVIEESAPGSAGPDEQPDHDVVAQARSDGEAMPDLVVAKHRRARVGALAAEHDRAHRVQHAASQQQRELGGVPGRVEK
jgi:hypothetical protein